jgi:hypothetical protein
LPRTTLEVEMADGAHVGVALSETLVLKDVSPRLWDLTGDRAPEVVVVESDLARGSGPQARARRLGRPR